VTLIISNSSSSKWLLIHIVVESLRLLRNPDQYAFLRVSGCTQVEGMDDKENFQVVRVRTSREMFYIFINQGCT